MKPTPVTAAEAESSVRSREESEPMLYCPVCNRRLASRKCKLLCEQCGYFMSCADYY
jgi:methionyl-tRNA synthetase